MAPRGPKTKPTHLKLVTGTERKGRTGEDEIAPPLALPMPPPHLSDEADPRRRTCRLDFVES